MNGNKVVQFHHAPNVDIVPVDEISYGKSLSYAFRLRDGSKLVLLTKGSKPPSSETMVIRRRGFTLGERDTVVDLTSEEWLLHPEQESELPDDKEAISKLRQSALDSWEGNFHFKSEDQARGIEGLRPPQLGAVYAAKSHFTIRSDPATIVMPTGTGKTETMISILVAERCDRLLVTVPTDALRTQLANKFCSLGVLKDFGVVADEALLPVVGILKHGFKQAKDLDAFIERCHVVVTTMPLVSRWSAEVQSRLASHFSHFFVDEAHHLGAPKWQAFRESFDGTKIVQFTATPYRNDERPIGGKMIFNYSLSQAQEDGYFKPITFVPVVEFDPREQDRTIAKAAVEQLRDDKGKGHMVMARVGNTNRAHEVASIYSEFSEFSTVEIHTGLDAKDRKAAREKIVGKKADIVVCVDMLGEGFDLPELKIAAFHDIRQTLPITLQLAGRFTRSRKDLGDATFVANIADVNVKDELRKLYQKDVDWNQLLPQYSDKAISDEFDLWEFLGGFKKFPKEISLQNVRPAKSAVVYKTRCVDWTPENFAQGIKGYSSLDRVYHDINSDENTLVILTTERQPLEWAKIHDIYSWDWQLYIVIWDREQQLLFINNSSNSGYFKDFAKAVCGDDVTKIGGPEIFRCLATVTRLRLNNVGLLEQVGKFIRFTMRAGSDVESGMTEAQKQRAKKSNLFGSGFENGGRTSIGCSYKGRIWSHEKTNVRELKRWCLDVGSKLIDRSLDPEAVLAGTLKPEFVSQRPKLMPIAVDWPVSFFRNMGTATSFDFGGRPKRYWHEVSIELESPKDTGELRFSLVSEDGKVTLGLKLFKTGNSPDFSFAFRKSNGTVTRGAKTFKLNEYFNENPPTVWFADGTSLTGHEIVKLAKGADPFPNQRVETWNWTGTNLKRESQGIAKDKTSIQFRVITELKKQKWSVVFDDDDTNESADVVGIRETENTIEVFFYHCKWSKGEKAGHRIDDLYQVCGQAQKSVRWMEDPTSLYSHLLKREPRMKMGKTGSRFEIGDENELLRIREKSNRVRTNLHVFVVQPGVSKKQISKSQLELLGVTETYLKETFQVSFGVIVNQ